MFNALNISIKLTINAEGNETKQIKQSVCN